MATEQYWKPPPTLTASKTILFGNFSLDASFTAEACSPDLIDKGTSESANGLDTVCISHVPTEEDRNGFSMECEKLQHQQTAVFAQNTTENTRGLQETLVDCTQLEEEENKHLEVDAVCSNNEAEADSWEDKEEPRRTIFSLAMWKNKGILDSVISDIQSCTATKNVEHTSASANQNLKGCYFQPETCKLGNQESTLEFLPSEHQTTVVGLSADRYKHNNQPKVVFIENMVTTSTLNNNCSPGNPKYNQYKSVFKRTVKSKISPPTFVNLPGVNLQQMNSQEVMTFSRPAKIIKDALNENRSDYASAVTHRTPGEEPRISFIQTQNERRSRRQDNCEETEKTQASSSLASNYSNYRQLVPWRASEHNLDNYEGAFLDCTTSKNINLIHESDSNTLESKLSEHKSTGISPPSRRFRSRRRRKDCRRNSSESEADFGITAKRSRYEGSCQRSSETDLHKQSPDRRSGEKDRFSYFEEKRKRRRCTENDRCKQDTHVNRKGKLSDEFSTTTVERTGLYKKNRTGDTHCFGSRNVYEMSRISCDSEDFMGHEFTKCRSNSKENQQRKYLKGVNCRLLFSPSDHHTYVDFVDKNRDCRTVWQKDKVEHSVQFPDLLSRTIDWKIDGPLSHTALNEDGEHYTLSTHNTDEVFEYSNNDEQESNLDFCVLEKRRRALLSSERLDTTENTLKHKALVQENVDTRKQIPLRLTEYPRDVSNKRKHNHLNTINVDANFHLGTDYRNSGTGKDMRPSNKYFTSRNSRYKWYRKPEPVLKYSDPVMANYSEDELVSPKPVQTMGYIDERSDKKYLNLLQRPSSLTPINIETETEETNQMAFDSVNAFSTLTPNMHGIMLNVWDESKLDSHAPDEYPTDYPLEKDDIEDPNWNRYRYINTDTRHFTFIRKWWGRRSRDCLASNLTLQNYKRGKSLKSRSRRRKRKIEFKSPFSSSSSPKKMKRTFSSTIIQDKELEENRDIFLQILSVMKTDSLSRLDTIQENYEKNCQVLQSQIMRRNENRDMRNFISNMHSTKRYLDRKLDENISREVQSFLTSYTNACTRYSMEQATITNVKNEILEYDRFCGKPLKAALSEATKTELMCMKYFIETLHRIYNEK